MLLMGRGAARLMPCMCEFGFMSCSQLMLLIGRGAARLMPKSELTIPNQQKATNPPVAPAPQIVLFIQNEVQGNKC